MGSGAVAGRLGWARSLADELEAEGYERWTAAVGVPEPAVTPFTDPFGDPFADLLT